MSCSPDPPLGIRYTVVLGDQDLFLRREMPAEAAVATMTAVSVSKFVRLSTPGEPPAGGF